MTKPMKEGERTFKVVRATTGRGSLAKNGGRYVHRYPEMAAKKAGRMLMAKAEASGRATNTVTIELHEITKTSPIKYSREVYFYTITRTANPESHAAMGFSSKWKHLPAAATAADKSRLDNVMPPQA